MRQVSRPAPASRREQQPAVKVVSGGETAALHGLSLERQELFCSLIALAVKLGLVVVAGISLARLTSAYQERMERQGELAAVLELEQTKLLKAKLDAVPDGGVIVMIAPPNPFRCPPGPYERVSMMAHALKKAGKTKARIVVLDPKDKFSKQGLFMEGWEKHYKGMVEWLSPDIHSGVKSVDPKTGTVVTGFETYRNAALVNVIPAQMAGAIARTSGLANDKGWCPIKPESMQSAMDPNIYVLGDASIAGDMPKSAFSANSQAKVAAMMIRGELTKSRTFPARYANTCWSLIETDDTVKVGGSYEAKDGKITTTQGFVSKTGETAELRKQTQVENVGWYEGITADMFG